MSSLESPERPAGIPDRSPAAGGHWSAMWAIAIALAAVTVGGLVLLVATALRDALVELPAHQSGVYGLALHGTPPVLTFAATLAQDAVLVAGSVLAAARGLGGRVTAAHFGFLAPRRPGLAAAYVVGGYLVFVAAAAGWTALMDVTDRENIAVDLGTRDSALALLGAGFLVCVVAPIAEELFFRGFIFGGLRRHGVTVAVLLSGTLFGLSHLGGSPLAFIPPLALLGMILALVYHRTGSLYTAIGLHALNNAIAFGAGDGRLWLIPLGLAGAGLATLALHRTVARTP